MPYDYHLIGAWLYGKSDCPKACIGCLLVYLLYALAVGIVNGEV